MAWNPNIPTVTNRVQDDLNAIRENFQHLDQLAERVDELQTVSELAPVAGELQAVSGLAQITNDLQTVSGLAPYVQAILGSRIVEMGSNANGEYVRWENGLQLCYYYGDLPYSSTGLGRYIWTFPASFADTAYAVSGTTRYTTADIRNTRVMTLHWTYTTSVSFLVKPVISTSVNESETVDPLPDCSVMAVGRWK